MSVQRSLSHSSFEVFNGFAPKKGPRSMHITIDLSVFNPYQFDLSLVIQRDILEWVQAVYIDNSANPAPFSLKALISNQSITCPAFSQGYFPMVVPNAPGFIASSPASSLIIPVEFLNFPVPAAVWGANPNGAGGNVSIIGTTATAADNSIAAGGTAQQIFGSTIPADGYGVYNPDAVNDLWVSDSGTAAPNASGSIRVAANGGWYETPVTYKPVGAPSIYGAVTGQFYTARRW